MNMQISQGLAGFTPISLEALNGKAAMLERLDHKYIVPADRLQAALAAFAPIFDVLEIKGQRAYYDHHQGRRKRCKVRVRHYVEANLSFLEVKLKDARDVTVKKRLPLEAPLSQLDQRCMDFIDDCYSGLYGETFDAWLFPVIAMEYRRITLVAREGGERLTTDTGLHFAADDAARQVAPDLFIIETKSARGNGIADKILRGLHLHPTGRCSKYCIGMAALGQVQRHNRFLPAMRKLQLAPGAMTQPQGMIAA